MKSIYLFAITLFFFSNLNTQEITMFSSFTGYKYYQDDKEITKDDLKTLLYKNEELKKYWKRSDTQEAISIIALAAEFGFGIWMSAEILNDDPFLTNRDKAKKSLGPALGTIGTGILAGVFMYASNNSKKKAILQYNKQFDKKATFRLIPTSNRNDLELALCF